MNDLKSRLIELSERGTQRGTDELRRRVMLDLASHRRPSRSAARGWGIAVAAAVVTVAVIAVPFILFGGPGASNEPVAPADTATTPPDLAMLPQPVNGTEDVAITSDGSLWYGFTDGLRRWDLTTGRVTVYTELDGLPSRNTHLLAVAPDDTVWAVSAGRLVRFDGTWMVESVPELDELTQWGSNVGALTIAPDGDVLVAVGRDRLIRYDGSEAIVIDAPEYVSSDPWAGSLAVAPDGTIWAVLESGAGVASFDGDRWTVYHESDGVPWLASNIRVGDDGTAWIGTTSTWNPLGQVARPANGIGRFDGTSWTTFTTNDGLAANSGSIIIAPDATVWVLHSALPDSFAEAMGVDSPPPGFSRLDGATWTSVAGEDQGGGPGVIALDGTVWTAKPDSITGFRDGALTTFSMPDDAIPPGPDEEPSTALPYSYPAGGSEIVTVHVSGIEGANGWRVAGVLFIGPNQMYPDTRAVGGFTAAIDSDSFSTTQIVTTPADGCGSTPDVPDCDTDYPYVENDFPWVTDEPVGLAPGTYTLAVYVGDRLGPYSRWVPGCDGLEEVTLYDRVQTFEVTAGRPADIEIEFDLGQQRDLCSDALHADGYVPAPGGP